MYSNDEFRLEDLPRISNLTKEQPDDPAPEAPAAIENAVPIEPIDFVMVQKAQPNGAYQQNGFSGTNVPPTPPTPPTYTAPKRAKREKPQRRGMHPAAVFLLCLLCAMIGAGASVGAFALLGTSADSVSAESSNTTSVVQSSSRTTSVETVTVEAGEKMTVSEIYATYACSVVCIEVSTDSGTGAGTGFVVTSDGYIVTCYHVIDDANDIAVTFPSDNTSYEATLVGGDEDEDIAVLKIDATDLTPVVLGDSSQLQVGDTVTAIGNALGTLSNTTTTGVVSALDRAISMEDGTVMTLLQTDCTVNSGNSGGPLFNEYGEVIGIVNAKYSSSGSDSEATIEGIGFAIPYSNVASKITDLMEYGYITGKPYLGITVSTVTPLAAQQYNMVVGAYVNSVTEGSCAEAAGLEAGDIITAVDGTEITTYEELVTAKNTHSAGEEMTLEVWRDNETLTLTVILDEEQPETETTTSNTQQDSEDASESEESTTVPNSDMPQFDDMPDGYGGSGSSGSSGRSGRSSGGSSSGGW